MSEYGNPKRTSLRGPSRSENVPMSVGSRFHTDHFGTAFRLDLGPVSSCGGKGNMGPLVDESVYGFERPLIVPSQPSLAYDQRMRINECI